MLMYVNNAVFNDSDSVLATIITTYITTHWCAGVLVWCTALYCGVLWHCVLKIPKYKIPYYAVVLNTRILIH